ncbi:hypothetical protein [Streptomyces mexicanus]|uniref:hypothetical protein n=1 Tax=Streptomyces mexicanus TaxID=178566 RepID=UPI0036CDF4AC
MPRSRRLERTVAVKCARPDDVLAGRRLIKEGRYAARLRHPHIVGVCDVLQDGADGACRVVMEYVPWPPPR